MLLCFIDAKLSEYRISVGNIPMLAELSIPEPEHIDDVVVDPVSCSRKAHQTVSGMGPRIRAVNKNQIPLSNHHIDSALYIGNSLEERFVKFNKPGPALRGDGIMLNVILMDVSAHDLEIVPAKHFCIEIADRPLVSLLSHGRCL